MNRGGRSRRASSSTFAGTRSSPRAIPSTSVRRTNFSSLFSPDPWLAETLGCQVFRLAPQAVAEQKVDVASAMSHLAGGGDAFFYAKLPTDAVGSSIELVNAGFTVVDTSITFSWCGPASTSP